MEKRKESYYMNLLRVGSHSCFEFDQQDKADDLFETIKEIGKGGFGSVLLLRHKPSQMEIAGKIVNPDVMTKTAQDSLSSEIELMKKINTPYTIKYYGNIVYHGSTMILIEFCDKGSLRDILDMRKCPFSEQQAAFIIHDLLEGIYILHKKYNIVHRDIKAGNILFTTKEEIRITDFGLSRELTEDDNSDGTIPAGTPYWMAPEVINGTVYGFPADVWSIGATTMELVEGQPPYYELEPAKAMMRIAKMGFPGFRKPDEISDELKDFIVHCMTKDPAKRYSIEQLLEHPWITQLTKLDRLKILMPLTLSEVSIKKIIEAKGTNSIELSYNSLEQYNKERNSI